MGKRSESVDIEDDPSVRDTGADTTADAIVETVSELSDVDPREMDTRLYDVIDPDALRRLVDTGGPGVQVSFRFDAYRVSVFGDGEFTVAPTASAGPS